MRRIKAKAHANTSLALNSSQHQQMQEEKELTLFLKQQQMPAAKYIQTVQPWIPPPSHFSQKRMNVW